MRRLLFPAVLGVVAVGVLIVPILLITKAVGDATDDPFRGTGLEGVPSYPVEIEPGQSLYREKNFTRALAALKKKEGAGAKLLALSVQPWMAEFRVGVGEGLRGYRWYAKNGRLIPFSEKISGSESIEPKKFPLESVRAGITAKLDAAVRERVRGGEVTNMGLDRDIIDRALEWSVVADSPTRSSLVFLARLDGSGVADPTTFSRRKQGLPES